MLNLLFPKQFDNVFRGKRVALWLLVPLTLVKFLQGMNVTLNSAHVLKGADRVPVDTFPSDAAAHLTFMFAAWGLGIVVLSLLATIALLRYRAMIPLVYLMLLLEQLGRKLLSVTYLDAPFVSTTLTAASVINWAFLLTIVTGLLLSIWARKPPSDTGANAPGAARSNS